MTSAERPGGNLVLACIDPLVIRAPVTWEHCDLSVSRVKLPDQEEGFRVADLNADVEILCGKVEVSENVKLY